MSSVDGAGEREYACVVNKARQSEPALDACRGMPYNIVAQHLGAIVGANLVSTGIADVG